jgi:hypothetical protein
MRKTRKILRLHFESHLVPGQIASICKVSRSSVQRSLERLKAAGLGWPLPAELDDLTLERRLYPPMPVMSPEQRCLLGCAPIHKELKSRKNVTLQLLWEPYKQANPLGHAYSWYCELYREWQHRLDVVLRQEHRAGEETFVDYAGQTIPVTLGVIRPERKYGAERLEAPCTRAVCLKLNHFQSVKSMLQSGLDRPPLPELLLMPSSVTHENLRGPRYYGGQQTRRDVGQC